MNVLGRSAFERRRKWNGRKGGSHAKERLGDEGGTDRPGVGDWCAALAAHLRRLEGQSQALREQGGSQWLV